VVANRLPQPTLEVVRKMALALGGSADVLVFDEDERGGDEGLRQQIEATVRLDADERQVIKTFNVSHSRLTSSQSEECRCCKPTSIPTLCVRTWITASHDP
jgi:hypothetical protein